MMARQQGGTRSSVASAPGHQPGRLRASVVGIVIEARLLGRMVERLSRGFVDDVQNSEHEKETNPCMGGATATT